MSTSDNIYKIQIVELGRGHLSLKLPAKNIVVWDIGTPDNCIMANYGMEHYNDYRLDFNFCIIGEYLELMHSYSVLYDGCIIFNPLAVLDHKAEYGVDYVLIDKET